MADMQQSSVQQAADTDLSHAQVDKSKLRQALQSERSSSDNVADTAHDALEKKASGMALDGTDKAALKQHSTKLSDISEVVGNAAAGAAAGLSLNIHELKALQKGLNELNGGEIQVSGKLDDATKAALSEYKTAHGFKPAAGNGEVLTDIGNRLDDKAREMKEAAR